MEKLTLSYNGNKFNQFLIMPSDVRESVFVTGLEECANYILNFSGKLELVFDLSFEQKITSEQKSFLLKLVETKNTLVKKEAVLVA